MEELKYDNLSSKNQNEPDQKAIDKALSTKCKKHPSRNAEYLHLLPNVQTAKICYDCIQQDKIPAENYVQICKVLAASSESDLLSYPILSDPLLRGAVQHNGEDLNSVQQEIDKFFLEIMKLMQVKIENNKITQEQKVIELRNIYQRFMAYREEIMDLKNLQHLLLEDDNDEKIAQFIRNHYSISEDNTQRLREISNQFSAIKNQFSLVQPNQIRNLILGLLEELNFFKGSDPSPLRAIEQSNELNDLLRKQQELEVSLNQNREAQQKILEYQQIIQELSGEKEIQSNEITSLKHENSFLKQQIDNQGCCQSDQATFHLGDGASPQSIQSGFQQKTIGDVFHDDNYHQNNKKMNISALNSTETAAGEIFQESQMNNFKQSLEASQEIKYEKVTAGDKSVHYPSSHFATPIDYEPDCANNQTKLSQQRYGNFIYDSPQFEDSEAVELQWYLLEDGSMFKGEWKNGMRHGKGKLLRTDGSIYEGYWQNNMAHGKGRVIHSDGDVYEGQWKNDKADGQGTFTHGDGAKYIGQWVDDKQQGNGIETWPDGVKYEGQYVQGKRQGKGKFFFSDGSQYEGSFFDNSPHGIGAYYWADGRNYYGEWKNNKMDGYGEHQFSDGRKYNGNYLEDKKHGYGEYEWADGRKYKGQWIEGKQHGIGVYYDAQGKERSGEWDNGKRIKWNDDN